VEKLYIKAKLRGDYELLTELHGNALERRRNTAAAIGQSRSGAMQQWETEWNADKSLLRELRALIPEPDTDYKRMTPDELSKKLVALEKTANRVNILLSKYQEWEVWNEKKGDQLREDQRANRQRNMQSP
jgi:hypothetical protein